MTPPAVQAARAQGPLVWLDMDQKALDDAYDQLVYAPNRDQVHKRNIFNSDRAPAHTGSGLTSTASRTPRAISYRWPIRCGVPSPGSTITPRASAAIRTASM